MRAVAGIRRAVAHKPRRDDYTLIGGPGGDQS